MYTSSFCSWMSGHFCFTSSTSLDTSGTSEVIRVAVPPWHLRYLAPASPDHIHGGGSSLEEVCGVLNGWDVAQDTFPDVL